MNLHPLSQLLTKSRLYLLYGYAALVPFSEWLNVRINNILLIVLCAIWVVEVLLKKATIRPLYTPVFYLLSGIFFIQLIDIFHHEDFSLAGKNIFLKLPFFLFPLVLSHVALLPHQLQRLYQFFTGGCLLACMITFRFLLQNECADVNWLQVADYEEYLVLQRPYFGIYLTLAICLLFTLYKTKKQFFYLLPAFLFLFFIWIIQAKMALLILVGIVILETLKHIKSKYRNFILLLCSSVALVVMVSLSIFYLQHRNAPNNITGNQRFFVLSINTRLEHFYCAGNIIKEHPLLGIGIGNLQQELKNCYDERRTEFNKHGKYFNIHNEWLEETARHGLLGLTVYILSFLLFFRRSRDRKNHLYLLFLFIIVAAGLTETIFSRAQGVLMIAFFNTLFFFMPTQTEEERCK